MTNRPKSAQEAAEEALGQSQRRYRELVEQSLGLICAHDFKGRLLFVNPAAAHSLGYEPEEGAGANLRDFLAPGIRDRFDAYLERIRRNGVDAGLMRLVARDGRERVWMYRNVLYDEPPEPPRVLGHAVDITERVKAEEALRASQDALTRTLAELDTRVQERTAEVQAVLAREREHLEFWTKVSQQLAGVLDYESTLHTVSSLPVPFLADWSMLHIAYENGACRCVAGRHVDAARQAALDGLAADAPTLLPADCCITRVLNSGRPERHSGGPDDNAARLLGPGAHVSLVRELGVEAFVVVPLAAGGHVLATLSLVCASAGRLAGTDAAVLEDLGRRFALAIDRGRLYREAQEANRLKDEFLATLSHELRTPLNAVLGWSRILRSHQLDEKALRAAEVIERNATALTRLVEDLLDVSRVITGKLTLNERSVDLRGVLDAALESMRPAARAKGIELRHHVEPVAPVTGDEQRIQQVFWNLLSNAVKFTGSGGTVTVALYQIGNTVTATVTDTGVGIRREVLPFVFDRFRQADSSSTRSHGGLGLGLAIVRHIVELHGGSVTVQSVEGHGASFMVQLPASASPSEDERTPPAAPAGDDAQTGNLALSGTRALIVDDNPDARDLVAEIVRAAGGLVMTAASCGEALQTMRWFAPDVLIADIALPHEDGYQLIQRIREQPAWQGRQPAAIALTGYARAEDRVRALAAGYQEHVAKPVEPQTLIRIVRAVLDARPE